MFKQEETSQIIDFLNSLLENNKTEKFEILYQEALDELELRSSLLAMLYRYRQTFDGVE